MLLYMIQRPRKKGAKQPKLKQRLLDENTAWQTLEVTCYDGRTRMLQITSGTSLWFHGSGFPINLRQSAWYRKTHPTFSDAIANLRQLLWQTHPAFLMSSPQHDILKIPRAYFDTFIQTMCYTV